MPYPSLVSVGASHACAIVAGTLYCWGNNDNGGLGNGEASNTWIPHATEATAVTAVTTPAEVSAGNWYTCVLGTANATWCWGRNTVGELGRPTITLTNTNPVQVSGSYTQVSASVDGNHTCAITTDTVAVPSGAYCWGSGGSGQLGRGSTTNSPTPVPVSNTVPAPLVRISAGTSSTCGITTSGLAYCWGSNGNSQLGCTSCGGAPQTPTPVATSAMPDGANTRWAEISAGTTHTCGITTTGAAYCWGDNGLGQVGCGINNGVVNPACYYTVATPIAVDTSGMPDGSNTKWAQISAGSSFTCAVTTTGDAYCWGTNENGKLGNGVAPSTTSVSPAKVVNTDENSASDLPAGAFLTQISAGLYNACAMDTRSNVYCWGINNNGQLGNGTEIGNSNVPVLVVGGPVLPEPPTNVGATPGDGTATISWTASVSPELLVTGYTATAYLNGVPVATCESAPAIPGPPVTPAGTSCEITGLTNGEEYQVTVVAHSEAGDTLPSAPVTVTPEARAGELTITVPNQAPQPLPGVNPGGTTGGPLGTVTVTDDRGEAPAGWTVVAYATFDSATPISKITYWSGDVTVGGTGNVIVHQAGAMDAVELPTGPDTPTPVVALTAGSALNSASWGPTISVTVPLGAPAGTYTLTIYHSVS